MTHDSVTIKPQTAPLRPYQQEALEACLAAVGRGEHPVLAMPTGSGKSHLLAALAAALPGRILVVTHRRELIRQDHAQHYGDDAGIYSAGLGVRDTEARVLYAGVASIVRRMAELQQAGPFCYVLVDEAHRVVPHGESSMYRTVFEACPAAQRVGVTATPYRLDGGFLHQGAGAWFDAMPVNIPIRALTPEWLSPLRGLLTAHDIDVSHVRVRAGEFVAGDLAQAACEESAVEGALDELCHVAARRHRWLIFCVDVAHSILTCASLKRRGIAAGIVVGATPMAERDATLQAFEAGAYQALVNCEVLTTGFDCPSIDCIGLMRPTMSKGLLVQMLGRGSRQAEAKPDCVIVDLAGNLERHAPLEDLSWLDKTPARVTADTLAQQVHEESERLTRERQARHAEKASLLDPMESRVGGTHTYRVARMAYKVVTPRRYPDRRMLLAIYYCPERRPMHIEHFVLLEHDGWAREKAEMWCRRRGVAPGRAAQVLPRLWAAPVPTQIVVEDQSPYARVMLEQFDEA